MDCNNICRREGTTTKKVSSSLEVQNEMIKHRLKTKAKTATDSDFEGSRKCKICKK